MSETMKKEGKKIFVWNFAIPFHRICWGSNVPIEDELIRAQYEEARKFDQDYDQYASEFAAGPCVLCPVCKRNKLLENKGVIFCSCGVRIDAKVSKNIIKIK